MEDVAAGQFKCLLEVACGLGFDAGVPVCISQQQVLNGFSKNRVERIDDGLLKGCSEDVWFIDARESVGHVETKHGQRVDALLCKLWTEDALIRE